MARVTRQDQFERDIAMAWHVAAFQRQKKLPTLKSLLSKVGTGGTRAQTVEEQRMMLEILSATYGGRLRKVGDA